MPRRSCFVLGARASKVGTIGVASAATKWSYARPSQRSKLKEFERHWGYNSMNPSALQDYTIQFGRFPMQDSWHGMSDNMGGAFVWNHLVQLQRTLPFLKSLYELTRKWIKKPIHSLICEPVCMCVCVCILPKTALQSSIQLLVIHSLICLFARSCVHLFHKSSVFLIPSFIFPAFRSLVPHVPPYVHSGYII